MRFRKRPPSLIVVPVLEDSDVKEWNLDGRSFKTVLITEDKEDLVDLPTKYYTIILSWSDLTDSVLLIKTFDADFIVCTSLPVSRFLVGRLVWLQKKLHADLVVPWNLLDDVDHKSFLEDYLVCKVINFSPCCTLKETLDCFGKAAMFVEEKSVDSVHDQVLTVSYYDMESSEVSKLTLLNTVFCFDLPAEESVENEVVALGIKFSADFVLRVSCFDDDEHKVPDLERLKTFLVRLDGASSMVRRTPYARLQMVSQKTYREMLIELCLSRGWEKPDLKPPRSEIRDSSCRYFADVSCVLPESTERVSFKAEAEKSEVAVELVCRKLLRCLYKLD